MCPEGSRGSDTTERLNHNNLLLGKGCGMGIRPEISYPGFPALGAKRHQHGSKEAGDQQRAAGVGGP